MSIPCNLSLVNTRNSLIRNNSNVIFLVIRHHEWLPSITEKTTLICYVKNFLVEKTKSLTHLLVLLVTV